MTVATLTKTAGPVDDDGLLDPDYYEDLTMRVFRLIEGHRDQPAPLADLSPEVISTVKEAFEALQAAHCAIAYETGDLTRMVIRQLQKGVVELHAPDIAALDELYQLMRAADEQDAGHIRCSLVFVAEEEQS